MGKGGGGGGQAPGQYFLYGTNGHPSAHGSGR